jgi:hypothetical protein
MAKSRNDSRQAEEKIRLTAEEINKYSTEKKITINRLKIARINVPDDKIKTLESKCKTISGMDPNESIPVLLQILLEIDQRLKQTSLSVVNNNNDLSAVNQSQSLVETLAVVDNALFIFGQTDRVQLMGAWAKAAYLKNLNKDKTVAELQTLVTDAEKIKITADTVEFWIEVTTWLEGIFRRTADKIEKDEKTNEPKRDADGIFPRVDVADWTFYKATGLTKMDISLFYHRAAEVLLKNIASYHEQLRSSKKSSSVLQQVPLPQPVVEAASAVPSVATMEAVINGLEKPVANESESVKNASEYVDNNMRVEEKDESLTLHIVVPKAHSEFLQEICNVVNDMLANPLITEMRKDIFSSDGARIANFETALARFNLTASQKGVLSNYWEDATAAINGYLTRRSTLRSLLWYPAHYNRAKEAIDDLAAKTDPQLHLNIMFRLRRGLVGESSVELLKIVNESIMVALDRLCPKQFDNHHDFLAPEVMAVHKTPVSQTTMPVLTRENSMSSVLYTRK